MEAQSKEEALGLTAFVQVCLNGKVLEEREIRAPVLSIGRNPECDIVVDNAAVSAFHAMLSYRNGKLRVDDAASTNGIMSDGTKSNTIELYPGDSVQIAGKYSLRLVEAPSGFMPSATPKQSALPHEVQAETMLVDTTMLSTMGQNVRPAFVTLSQAGRSSWVVRLENSSTSIGRKGDIRVGGMLAPAQIAKIERREDGFYLVADKPALVTLGGEALIEPRRLREGERFQVKDMIGVFHERANRG